MSLLEGGSRRNGLAALTVTAIALASAAGGVVVGLAYAGQQGERTQFHLTALRLSFERVAAEHERLSRDNQRLSSDVRNLTARHARAVTTARSAQAVAHRRLQEICRLNRRMAYQQKLVRDTTRPILGGSSRLVVKRTMGAVVGWVPIAGDALDTALTGAVIIQDRRTLQALKNLDRKMLEDSPSIVAGC